MIPRLPFRLPEWPPRISWVSTQARQVWEPRIQAVSNAYLETERRLVILGKRPSALQHVSPERLPSLMQELAPAGVIVLPLGKVPRVEGYQSGTKTLGPHDPWDYRCAITRPEHAAAWGTAWAASDNDATGRLLGYPDCCRAFFQRVWVEEKWIDTTWPMAQDASAHTGVNMLWRWFGVRPVSYLPCSPTCSQVTKDQADTLAAMPPQEGTWLREILSWPVLWSSLHGVAEITTPIFRASVPTDPLASVAEVRYEGTAYPAEGARGVTFPYRSDTEGPAPSVSHLRNGFASHPAMIAAHGALIAVAAAVLGKGCGKTVVDLGCGDGALAKALPAARRVGVEREADRAREAGKILDRVVVADVTNAPLIAALLLEEKPDLVIAQADRNPPTQFRGLRVLSYSYETGAGPPRLVET